MPTPTERLENRKTLSECRVCAWLATLSEKDRREWAQAIANPRFGAPLIAAEIGDEVARNDGTGYAGQPVGESSVETHRQRRHR